jgi:hypothetical protein
MPERRLPSGFRWRALRACVAACRAVAFFLAIHAFGAPAFAQGQLDAIRRDVREPDPPNASVPDAPAPEERLATPEDYGQTGEAQGYDLVGAMTLGALVVAAPFVGPYKLLADDFSVSRSFAQFPYDNTAGYTTTYGLSDTRLWSAQFSTDYATTFNDLDSIGGHLLINTSTRFGFDGTVSCFQEALPNRHSDNLCLGDGNITFCFAQDEHMLWRTGLGMNWLTDSRQTDLGFNFTYGTDWFPCKPWVVSAAIDLGSLGHSGFFHFRSTVGVIVNRFEVYTGYEYYDFDRVQLNALIGGLRIWF